MVQAAALAAAKLAARLRQLRWLRRRLLHGLRRRLRGLRGTIGGGSRYLPSSRPVRQSRADDKKKS